MSKAQEEVESVRLMFRRLGLRPREVTSLSKDHLDPPDVLARWAGKTVAVEVTDYHRDLLKRGPSDLRTAEATIAEIEDAFDRIRDEFADVSADGQVFLRPSARRVTGASPDRLLLLPRRSEIEAFVRELLSFARANAHNISEEGTVFDAFGAGSPLIRKYVGKLVLDAYSWTPVWNFDPKAKTHGFSEEVWCAHVRRKGERLLSRLRQDPGFLQAYDQAWLVLTSHLRTSQMIAATLDHFRGATRLNADAEASPFGVIVIQEEWSRARLWRWRRDFGWDEVRATQDAGKPRRRRGGSGDPPRTTRRPAAQNQGGPTHSTQE